MPDWKRFFATISLSACLAGMPLTFSVHGLMSLTALAKGGNNGNGNGNSHGGNGNSQGGNSGDGNSQGNTNGKGTSSKSSTTTETDPISGDKITVSPSTIELVHRNGFLERIGDGRYQMRDGKGRLVIDRRATERDRWRLLTTVR